MEKEFGFIIPSLCDSKLHLAQLIRCIESIRRFHPDKKIIIVDDFSKVDVNKELTMFKNIKIVKSPVQYAGDMVTYDVFRNNHDFERAVILQDSMTLEKELIDIDKISSINYIWYFTNHRVHWSKIKEPKTEYNIKNNINVHDDAIIDCIKNNIKVEDFKRFALDIYHKKDKWSGCFGCLSIIDYNFVNELNEKTGIVDLLMDMNNNRLRRVAESLFALACIYVLGDEVLEKAYDGLYYDGKNSDVKKIKAYDVGLKEFDIDVIQVRKNEYFSKLSFNRNA